MDYYYIELNTYEVLMPFNVPLATAPEALAIQLHIGDTISVVDGRVFVKMNSKMKETYKNGTHMRAIFDKKFVELNPKIFKLI